MATYLEFKENRLTDRLTEWFVDKNVDLTELTELAAKSVNRPFNEFMQQAANWAGNMVGQFKQGVQQGSQPNNQTANQPTNQTNNQANIQKAKQMMGQLKTYINQMGNETGQMNQGLKNSATFIDQMNKMIQPN